MTSSIKCKIVSIKTILVSFRYYNGYIFPITNFLIEIAKFMISNCFYFKHMQFPKEKSSRIFQKYDMSFLHMRMNEQDMNSFDNKKIRKRYFVLWLSQWLSKFEFDFYLNVFQSFCCFGSTHFFKMVYLYRRHLKRSLIDTKCWKPNDVWHLLLR